MLNTITFGPVPCLTSIPWLTTLVMVLFAIMSLGDPKLIIPFVYWSWILLFVIMESLEYCIKIPKDALSMSHPVIVKFLLVSA